MHPNFKRHAVAALFTSFSSIAFAQTCALPPGTIGIGNYCKQSSNKSAVEANSKTTNTDTAITPVAVASSTPKPVPAPQAAPEVLAAQSPIAAPASSSPGSAPRTVAVSPQAPAPSNVVLAAAETMSPTSLPQNIPGTSSAAAATAPVDPKVTDAPSVPTVEAPPVRPLKTWSIRATDGRLATTFERWAKAENMKLVWDAQQHVMLSSSDTFTGTLTEALNRVLSSPAIRLSSYPLEACIYPNDPPLLRITRVGEQSLECPQ
jgi:hypothetical protein